MRHFLEIDDLSPDELTRVIELAMTPMPPALLHGQGAALIFEKPSGRTRNSMEVAVVQLGGHPTTIGPEEVGIDTRESAEDVARTLSCFHALIAARVFEHSKLERMAAVASVPVINLLSDAGHPIQALADICTIVQRFGTVIGGDDQPDAKGTSLGLGELTVAYVGDANNVAFSLGLACAYVGLAFVVSHPQGYGFTAEQLLRLQQAGGEFRIDDSPESAVDEAHVVYTDAWYSMGQETEAAVRSKIFPPWRVDASLMAQAAPDAIFMHCLPAHRGDEVTDDVLDGPQSVVWQQAENRLHSARGLMWFLLAEAEDVA